MGLTIKFTCDRCKTEQDKAEGMWDLKLYVKAATGSVTQYHQAPAYQPDQNALWCRPCVDEFKLMKRLIKADMPEKGMVTMEDIVREIAQEVVSDGNS